MRVNGIIHAPPAECTGSGLARTGEASLRRGIGAEYASLGGDLLGSLFCKWRQNLVSHAAEFGKKN
jgi:hypothetical protein